MKLRILMLLAVVLLGLGTPATNVRGDPLQLPSNQAGTYLYYFPLISATNQAAAYLYYFPVVSKQPETSSCSTAPLPPVDWDSRLGPGGLPLLDKVRIIPAQVAPCQKYWRVVVVKFEDITESGNDHTIYVKVLDEFGNRAEGERLHVTSWGGLSEYPDEKPAGDLCNCNFDFPMWGDAYSVHIDGALPSDIMADMIMPMRRHVNYRITFQRALNPS
jgi:hypothetical protein